MTPLDQHPLVGRRVRVAPHSQHYPNRYGVITQWLGYDTVMVSLSAYKRAPARSQRYWLTELIVQPDAVQPDAVQPATVQPEQGARHDPKSRTPA